MTSLNDIRSQFLQFFARSGHEIVPSAPLVPRNDPTLLFTNAGMVPFKNVFTGAETRAIPRAASSQKCVRAGGKHNDLDNVGYTARHHTFFEMLGNFSFGDYFKAEAIKFAWDLITKEFGLPVDKLLVTVYSEDEDAAAIWKKVAGLPESKIVRISTSDNFWSMGDTGPCGPCSEIFFDHGDKIAGGPPGSADADGDRFIEIWNLVFMQFEQEAGGARKPLPKPSIDTGMGLERIAAVLQGVHDNYDIDLFRALIRASAEASGVAADGPQAVSHRVIADHLRASSFLIADGVLPSNEGRGYVLRRIMRRAMRHAHLLGAADPLMWRLVPALVHEMGAAYPELQRAQALVTETLKLEETRFRQTLERGLKLLDDAVGSLTSGQILPGDVAFKLYDTYGFPYDLTEDALRARNIGVDKAGFDSAMARQRADARASWAGSGDQATGSVWLDLAGKLEASEFLGYDTSASEGRVVALVKDGQPVDRVVSGESAEVILNQTPFYGESGGQAGDSGVLKSPSALFCVADAQKRAGILIAHKGLLEKGELKIGDHVLAQIDEERRDKTRANHSATHLLHEALRRVLGEHVTQKGSSVTPERLRFDFSHQKPMSEDEIAQVEKIVNAQIRANAEIVTRVMSPDDAIAAGALALFGEKYGDIVRVLFMGEPKASERPFSIEFCGGTHARRIGDIALFKIVSESAVSSGVRRIEALTGEAARLYMEEQERFARSAAAELKTSPAELPARVAALIEERRRLERELSDAKKALALGGGASKDADGEIREVDGVKIMARVLGDIEAKDLRGLVDEAKKSLGSGVVAYIATSGGKASLAVGVTGDLTARINAVDLVRKGAEAVGGKGGGGRPDFAQAGGPDAQQAQAAIDAIMAVLASQSPAA